MFRLLKQYRNTGKFKIDIDDLRERLDVPEKYRMFDIDRRVLKVVEKELKDSFEGLKVKKYKKGAKVVSLEFTINVKLYMYKNVRLRMYKIA